MNNSKIGIIMLLFWSAGCSTAPTDKSGAELIATESDIGTGILSDDWETLRDAKIHYAQAMIAEDLSDTSRMREEYDLAVSLLGEIDLYDNSSNAFESEFQATANKVSKDYQLALRRLRIRYGNSSDLSLMEKLELFDSIDDTSGIAVKVLQKYADDLGMEIPLVINGSVMRIVRFFQTEAAESFDLWLKRKGAYQQMFESILEEEGLPRELVYLAMVESGFSPRAYSWAHAAGPWQFIYGTGRLYGLKRDWWVDERRNPIKSTHAAARYIKDLFTEFGDWYLVMAAYNSGSNRVKRAMKRGTPENYWELLTLPRETRNYVPSLIAATIIGEDPEAFGFDVNPESPLSFEEVKIKGSISLSVISKAAGVSVEDLRRLNPELRRNATPPRDYGYSLLLPMGTAEQFNQNFAELPEKERTGYVRHKVRRGEALSTIAARYGVPVGRIVRVNSIRNRNSIRAGKILLIPTNSSVFSSAGSKRIESRSAVPKNSKPIKYRVKKGDTLGHIAEYYNTTALKLRAWNGLRYGKPIYEGESLNVYLPEYLKLSQPVYSVADPRLFLLHYRVKPGESLSVLAAKFEVKTDELRLWNSIKGNELKAGSLITVWTMKAVEADITMKNVKLTIHTVRRGDTLWDIARNNGVSISEMFSWNPWAEDNPIKPGDRIKIYRR